MGFCVVLGGVVEVFGIILDLVVFGKVIGGGMLVGVFGGFVELMSVLVFLGQVYQVGMFFGNLVVMIVGLVMFDVMQCENVWM